MVTVQTGDNIECSAPQEHVGTQPPSALLCQLMRFPGPAAPASHKNWLKMQILMPNPISTESETLGYGSAICT